MRLPHGALFLCRCILPGACVASRKWPEYEVGRADYIFALGVLAANFNELEGALSLQFKIHVRIPYAAAKAIFARSDNAQRIRIIQGCLSITPWNHRDHPLPYNNREKAAIEHFLRGFAVCAENRNILLHSEAVPVGKKNRVFFYKDSKKPPHWPNKYTPSIARLRSIADAMRAFSEYGSDLAMALRDYYWIREELGLMPIRRPLPGRPRLPKILVPKPPVETSPPKAG
jgi:hypothetical protein